MAKLKLIILLITAVHCFGQQKTLKFVHSENLWQMSRQAWISGPSYWQKSFSKDSIKIGDKYYFKEMKDDKFYPGWMDTGSYFREENGRVYELKDQREILHYDFNLNVGDSLLNEGNAKLKVKKVENIITSDGLSRRKLIFDRFCGGSPIGEVFWIQGIGEMEKGYPLPLVCFTIDPEPVLDCFLQNGNVVYSHNVCLDPNLYKTMVSSEYIWQVNVSRPALPGVIERLYRFGPPKTINGKSYRELLKSEGHTPTSVNWSGTGMFFREEDSVVNYLENGVDIPYFDFTLQKGDKFDLRYGSTSSVFVIKTDTVLLADNKPRHRYYLGCDPSSDKHDVVWIEGIGDVYSFLFSYVMCSLLDPVETLELKCVFYADNYKDIFKADGVQGCFIANALDEKLDEKNVVKIYPNPSINEIEVEFQNPFKGSISIYDYTWKEHLKIDNIQQSKMKKLDITSLPNGMYILIFKENNGKTFSKKLVVQ